MRGRWKDAERSVAIVGSRAARTRDIDTAHQIAADLVASGALVLSGGAVGVDAAAHRGALEGAVRAASPSVTPTAAILGCGLDYPYPSQNLGLFDQICASGGAVISEFVADAPPRRWHFPRRNRTMAGMADCVLVIAASSGSGALQTARCACELGRVVAAVPGTPGCESLLAQGAASVRDGDDLACALAGQPRRPEILVPGPDTDAGQVLSSLDDREPRDADDISIVTGLEIRRVSRALTRLEMDGLAILLPGRNYVRSMLAPPASAR